MKYCLNFPANSNVVDHSYCCRCDRPTESSPVGTGTIPTKDGKEEVVKNLVVCLQCLELLHENSQLFWDTGWSR